MYFIYGVAYPDLAWFDAIHCPLSCLQGEIDCPNASLIVVENWEVDRTTLQHRD